MKRNHINCLINYSSAAMILSILLVFFLLLSNPVSAFSSKENKLFILAVSEQDNGNFTGSVATLSLEIKPGVGRVFIDLQPASKLDTQFSTKFANRMACNYINFDCSRYDFFYTIRANSAIIGGPSASTAVSLLTIASLLDLNYDNTMTITGNINSGYLVGHVGGVKAKITAAHDVKLTKVLIPLGERYYKEKDNITTDLVEYGDEIGIKVVEVGTLDEASLEFFGKDLRTYNDELVIDEKYTLIMKNLSDILCERAEKLKDSLINEKNLSKEQILEFELAENLTKQAEQADNDSFYYAKASFCYGANVHYSTLFLSLNDVSDEYLQKTPIKTSRLDKITDNRSIHTINDLQAYMIVKERIIQGSEFLEKAIKAKNKSSKIEVNENIAFAIERLNSAIAWSEFFDIGGKEYNIKESSLKDSCINKLSETEEQFQYLQLSFESPLTGVRNKLNEVHNEYNNQNYALCLYKASLIKAEINSILSSLGVSKDNADAFFEKKFEAARRAITDQQSKGIFPILGYSYYEYAQSLKDTDQYSTLLYLEYALELSNLDIYFEKEEKFDFNFSLYDDKLLVLLIGIMIGILLVLSLNIRLYQKKRRFKRLVRVKKKR